MDKGESFHETPTGLWDAEEGLRFRVVIDLIQGESQP